ncbi:hypothetical protein O6H91_09G035200 [Diphasiastrum complanatum]|uniref:Uncharacterized protein n=1 Tax=Diphasiastrum complanatum TaxID=34168 RepID=A0ACC2CN61_DIPCM|nr:hypothetical protein O6H91_Y408500 [Diphasiastrum complanatum]KAJ7543380.1 hypothetical protein O6H91_09G035200 [Diphasiastrum complanatum]
MVSIVLRAITILLGYIYPAYECFKNVERPRPDMESLRFWCRYWIILAVLTSMERVGDAYISWLPLYAEAKLAFIIYLWYPRTKGTTYIYSTYLKPFVASYEGEIDLRLNELKTQASDVASTYGPQASAYLQSMFADLLQYLASQSATPQSNQSAESSRASSAPAPSNLQATIVDDEDSGYDIIDEELEHPEAEEPVAAAYLSRNRRKNQGW